MKSSPLPGSIVSSTSKKTKPTPWPLSNSLTGMTDRWVWLFDRVIASDTKAARQVLDEMLAQLEAQHWQQRDIFAVHLATEEALVNAIYHGNDSDAGKNV